MDKKEYDELIQAIKADSPYTEFDVAMDMAENLIEDDPELGKYLNSICSDAVGRLASDLS